jgi:DNA-binding NarL/FixJ family response regulator
LDFEAWLSRMPSRRRQIAEYLAQGHQTIDVAKRFRLSPGRISQIREEFRRSWLAFQSD